MNIKAIFAFIMLVLMLLSTATVYVLQENGNGVAPPITNKTLSLTSPNFENDTMVKVWLSPYPNSTLTPGSIDERNLSVICVTGYSSTVRDVSEKTKREVLSDYGVDDINRSLIEMDHFFPLCAGGSNNKTNLFPEPSSKLINNYGFEMKDRLEVKICKMICAGEITQQEAFDRLTSDWIKFYNDIYGQK